MVCPVQGYRRIARQRRQANAADEDALGGVGCGPLTYLAWASAGADAAWRRALISHSRGARKQADMQESGLGVDSENLDRTLRVYRDCRVLAK